MQIQARTSPLAQLTQPSYQKSDECGANPAPPADSFQRSEQTEEKMQQIQSQLQAEWRFFGKGAMNKNGGNIRRGKQEHHSSVYKRVGHYWKNGTGLNYDGRDRGQPWSAAFISSMHKDADVGPQFKRSPAHAKYVRDAIFKKKAGDTSAAYWGHRVSERAPQVGDMVAYSRQRGITYDNQPQFYKSHCDIVTAVRDGEIEVIGGNVRHSVTKKFLKTDSKGLLADRRHRWFAILEPKNLEGKTSYK